MPTKLTPREFAESPFLMNAFGSLLNQKSKIIEQILASSGPPEHRSYEVEIRVNGVEMGWECFVKAISEQLGSMVNTAAMRIYTERLEEKTREIEDSLSAIARESQILVRTVKDKVRAEMGLPPNARDGR